VCGEPPLFSDKSCIAQWHGRREDTLVGDRRRGDIRAGAYLRRDWRTQQRTMISADAWAEYFRPAYATMIDLAHNRGLDA